MIGFCAAGFVAVICMREVEMQKDTDETYALVTRDKDSSIDLTTRSTRSRGNVADTVG